MARASPLGQPRPMRFDRDDVQIDTDRARLDLDLICDFLATSYWAEGVPRENLERAFAHSLCFGMYRGEAQIGFARVVTDTARFAWLADVFVLDSERGRGLGKWLIECVTRHPELARVDSWLLGTRDAHGLYEQYGWMRIEGSERFMGRPGADAILRARAAAQAGSEGASSAAAVTQSSVKR